MFSLASNRLIDCTHTIDSSTFSFVASPSRQQATYTRFDGTQGPCSEGQFAMAVLNDTRTVEPRNTSGYIKCIYRMSCDVGTHIDAPSHWFPGSRDISQLKVEELTCNGVVIDVTSKISKRPYSNTNLHNDINTNSNDYDYELTVNDILDWEKKHNCKIPKKSLVVMKTGWSSRFNDHKSYLGLDENGKSHFPGFSAEAAQYLASCDVQGLGIDTPSLDPGFSTTFPVHQIMLGSDRYLIENMLLDGVPEIGVTFISLPLKIKGGPEAEARVLAIARL